MVYADLPSSVLRPLRGLVAQRRRQGEDVPVREAEAALVQRGPDDGLDLGLGEDAVAVQVVHAEEEEDLLVGAAAAAGEAVHRVQELGLQSTTNYAWPS